MNRELTFNVRIYKTYVYKGKRGNTYTVRWKVEDDTRSKVFSRAAQAEAYRSELHAAARKGEAFSQSSGEPVSWGRARRTNVSWYDFACLYVDMKWKAASAKYRQDIARALVAATPPLILGRSPASDLQLRSALNLYGFNTKRRAAAPEEMADLVWFMAGEGRAAYVTGETLTATGGSAFR